MYLVSKYHRILYWEYLPPFEIFFQSLIMFNQTNTVQLKSTAWCPDFFFALVRYVTNFSDSIPPKVPYSLEAQTECLIGEQDVCSFRAQVPFILLTFFSPRVSDGEERTHRIVGGFHGWGLKTVHSDWSYSFHHLQSHDQLTASDARKCSLR